jgi:hypothetical protein
VPVEHLPRPFQSVRVARRHHLSNIDEVTVRPDSED